ncbi:hypothetical protein LTR37_003950 [Vermiconidia calcicola]|uniref:Uncharacterized protein n=1 Tax=Vermiconidia calcicola TaxID=1690605 RepID=A0ACC3NP34_9PEZI|nr:hypothetical protein LTR37_003950 [Vermiconidia calcicola]
MTGYRTRLDVPGMPECDYFVSGASKRDRRPEYTGRVSSSSSSSIARSNTYPSGKEVVRYVGGQELYGKVADDDIDSATVSPADSISQVSSNRSGPSMHSHRSFRSCSGDYLPPISNSRGNSYAFDSYSTIGSEVSRSTARSGAGGSAVSSDRRDISQRTQQTNFDYNASARAAEGLPQIKSQARRAYEDDETPMPNSMGYNTVERRPKWVDGKGEGSSGNSYLSTTSSNRRYNDDSEDERDTVGYGSRVKSIGPNVNDLPMSQRAISYDLRDHRTTSERNMDARNEGDDRKNYSRSDNQGARVSYEQGAQARSQIDYDYDSDDSVEPCESASQVSSSRGSPVRSEVSRTSGRSRRSGRASDARSNITPATSASTVSQGSKRSQRPQGDEAGSEVSRRSGRSGRSERESNNGSTVSKTSSVQSTESRRSNRSKTSQPDYEDSVAGSTVSKNTYTAIEKAGQAMLPNRGRAPANNGSTVSKAASVQSTESKRSKGSYAPQPDYEDSVAGSEVSRSTYTASEKGARQPSPRGRRPLVRSAANNTYGPNDDLAAASVRSNDKDWKKRKLRSPPLKKQS